VPNENGTVARIDLATNAVVTRIRVGADPDSAVLCRGRLWVSSLRGPRIYLIDPAWNRVPRWLKVGRGSAGMACGRSVWLANYDTGRLLRIDPATRKVRGQLALGGQPRSVIVAGGASGFRISAWGRSPAFASAEG
jgi:DNA-binding beta-propeller fold protein YncE